MGGQWWYEAFLYVISYASHQCINIHRRTVRVNWNTLECMFCPTLHPGWIWSDSCSRQLKKLKDKGMVTMIASVCHVRGHTPFFFAKLWQKHSNICCNVYCSIYRSRNTKKGIENVTWDLDISCFLIFYVLDSAQRDRIWFSNVFFPHTNTGFWTWSRLYLKERLILSIFFCNGSLVLLYESHIWMQHDSFWNSVERSKWVFSWR